MYIAGEDIRAGSPVIQCTVGGKLHTPPCTAGHYVGDAGDSLREGFRCVEREGLIYEDDA